MKKTTLCILTLLYPIIYITAQVCPPSVFSSGQGSHNLTITSSDEDFNIVIGDCVDLVASYTEIGETSDYAVRSINFNPSWGFGDVGSDTGLFGDDRWSQSIPIGFNFTMYEECFSESRLSTNGAVSFDPNLTTNQFHHFAPEEGAFIPSNTDAALKDGNIFGAIHDMDANEGEDPTTYYITYGVKGQAPFRVFTYNFFNVPHYNCTSLRTFQQIYFYETTNVVEVYIYHKPVCTGWAGGRAALGIQNVAGTQGLAAPERNTSDWVVGDPSLTNGEAWQFYPTGSGTYSIKWFDESNTEIGTDNTLNVCPTTTTTYTLELTYTALNSSCEEVNAVVTRCVTINVEEDTDGDGVADVDEDLNENDNLDDDDTDEDTIPNYLDTDDDGDSVPTSVEINIDEGRILHNFVDTDGDLIENYLDNDDDGDGLLTIEEDYNNNGDPTDDDTNTNGIPDYLENGVTLSVENYNATYFTIYPNPVNDILNISTSSQLGNQLSIAIYNIQGKLISDTSYNLETTNFRVDVSNLSTGLYVIKFYNDDIQEIKKLIIN